MSPDSPAGNRRAPTRQNAPKEPVMVFGALPGPRVKVAPLGIVRMQRTSTGSSPCNRMA